MASAFAFIRRHPWWTVSVILALLAIPLVLWARTRPGYDPYGWLVWGYETIHGHLDLAGAPSWKPLPLILTAPFALFGHYELWLWMFSSVAISLLGCLFTARIAYRLVLGGEQSNRWPAIAAAVFAGAALLGIENYMHIVLSVQSDPMIVTLFVAAWDAYLSGHERLAFVVGCVAGLGRPEVWSTLAPFTIWLWIKRPHTRKLLVVGWVVILFGWFGIPTITNGRPFLAEQLALRSPRAPHGNKIIASFHRYTELTYLPMQLGAVFALVVAWLRRNWATLLVGASAVIWVLTETALDLKGLPGQPRYIFEPAALQTALAGVALGWLLIEIRRRGHLRLRIGAGVLAAALVGPMVPAAVARVRFEHRDLAHERDRTKVINLLSGTINHLGGPKAILRCGHPVTNTEYASLLAWLEHVNVDNIGYLPKKELKRKYPILLFIELPNGWETQAYHDRSPASMANCKRVTAAWIQTHHHPYGVLVPGR
ncbi:MAG TPA: hypothetical protein VG410_11470 [Solirubrobacteraceae bacterium]|nr:hypothetical protein [Solirubrobacteraceae bacterium]